MGAKVPLLATVRIYYIGVFFNMWTPGGLLGDAVRIWHAHRAGLTLPFVSYGGSSLVVCSISAGLILNVAARWQPGFSSRDMAGGSVTRKLNVF